MICFKGIKHMTIKKEEDQKDLRLAFNVGYMQNRLIKLSFMADSLQIEIHEIKKDLDAFFITDSEQTLTSGDLLTVTGSRADQGQPDRNVTDVKINVIDIKTLVKKQNE